MTIRRGDVFLVALDPVVGSEIAKTRPVVIISNDVNNQFAATVTVLPITSGGLEKIYPFEVFIKKRTANLPKESKVKANQIRTVDKSRLLRKIGELDASTLLAIEDAIKIHLGLS